MNKSSDWYIRGIKEHCKPTEFVIEVKEKEIRYKLEKSHCYNSDTTVSF